MIPAYNESRYVGAALKALQQQDFRGDYEIIVVDNNSTDDTAEIAASYGVRVVHEPEPGVCQARQRGMSEASGEIVVSTDADTVQPATWLSRIDLHFRSSPDVVGVCGPCRYEHPSWWADLYPRLLFGTVAAVFRLSQRVFYVSATNTAFRRAAFSGYDLTMTQGGDELDLLRRLRRVGRVVWDRHNVVDTSARRLQRGLAYSLFVSFFTYYLLAYWINRLSSRPLLGMAPAFRQEASGPKPARMDRTARRNRRWRTGITLALLLATFCALARLAVPAAVSGLVRFWAGP